MDVFNGSMFLVASCQGFEFENHDMGEERGMMRGRS